MPEQNNLKQSPKSTPAFPAAWTFPVSEANDLSNVTTMSYMFYGCTSLTTIYVCAMLNTNNIIISKNMFSGCISLAINGNPVYRASMTDKSLAYAGIKNGLTGYFTLVE